MHNRLADGGRGARGRRLFPFLARLAGLPVFLCSLAVQAQEVRYSWFEISYLQQDTSESGMLQTPVPGQTVAVDTSDGNGIRFRGSVGTWNNFYAFFEFGSSDLDVNAIVSNAQGDFPAEDEFDLTTIRGGVGLRYSLGFSTDLFAEVTLDSLDYDFGSFAGENFDADQQELGGAIGVRSMLGDRFEARARVRFNNVGDVELGTTDFDADTLYGAGLSFTVIRGLSLTADFETGEIDTWSIGFRIDLDED